eukprot:4845065-Amphidinium_carterae.1
MTNSSVTFSARGHSVYGQDESVGDASEHRAKRSRMNTLALSEVRALTSEWDGESFRPMATERSMMSHSASTRRGRNSRVAKHARLALKPQWAKVDLENPPKKDSVHAVRFQIGSLRTAGTMRFGKSARVTLSLPSFQSLSMTDLESSKPAPRKINLQHALSLGSLVAPQRVAFFMTIHPHGFRRASWDMFSCALIAYD